MHFSYLNHGNGSTAGKFALVAGRGSRELDRAAVHALSLCQFKPAMHNGVPEAGWAQIAYVWSLE